MPTARPPAQRYAALCDTLGRLDGVTEPTDEPGKEGKFGSAALKIHGRIFAMLVRDALVVKLPAARVSELVAQGEGAPFDAGKGRPMREWLTISPDSSLDWHEVAREALTFVAGARR
jgi:hypothetical protein